MKYLQNKKGLLVIMVLAFVLIIIAVSQIGNMPSGKEERKRVSLIVYGEDDERWENLRQGAGLVCGEKNADISLLTMLTDSDVAEQEEMIEREIEDGTDALIIAACNSSEIRDYIRDRKPDIPVVFIGSVEDLQDGIDQIATDDYKMGYDLGEAIAENESDIVTVAIISENTERDSVALREKGLRDALEGNVGRIINWTRNGNEKTSKARVFIQKALVSEATDVIVTLDNSTTDSLLEALTNLNKKSKVYSISTSDQAVYCLYSGEIKVLEYPDEFSMGYLAAMHVLDRTYAKKKYENVEIDYRIVRKENMYDEDNQALLFPFVN